ncbi:MAG TPA: flavodoxin family protein, partial [Pseudogulbenkiania sp.]|nr:flavodoxin family protein [Pseudogulbenkiania sp.]
MFIIVKEFDPMTKLAVIYHSGYGHTARVAQFVAEGAGRHAEVALYTAEEASAKLGELAAYDAIVFGAPTYMGSVSAGFKAFMDASAPVWFKQGWKDKVAAGFTVSNSPSGDKLGTLQQLSVFAAQHSMIWVSTGELPASVTGSEINRYGSFLGLMTRSDNAPAEQTPDAADLESARRFGERVAIVADQLRRGGR